MDCPVAALKNSEVRNHAVPIMLGERRRVIPAMAHEGTAPQHQRKAQPRTLHRSHAGWGRSFLHLRQILLQLGLRIAKLRAEMDTLHSHRLRLAMIKARQAQDAALIDAGSIPMEMCREALLHSAEGRHVAVLHEPVSVQGFPGFHNERRFQRKRLDLFELLLHG